MTNRPTYTVELGIGVSTLVMVVGLGVIGTAAIGASADDGVTWTQISGVREIHIARGRQDELSRMEAGTCEVVCDNTSGAFAPENAASAYYPNLKPGLRIRVRASWPGFVYGSAEYGMAYYGGTTVDRFYGQINRFVPVPGAADAEVRFEATDLFRRLARQRTTAAMSQQASGARIGALLDELEIPSSLRDLDTGQSTVPSVTLATTTLQHAQDVTEVEDGRVWVAPSGKTLFRDRFARLTRTRSVTSLATFGGSSGLPYSALGDYDLSDELVRNNVAITRTGGSEQLASDEASQRQHGVIDYTLSSDHFLNDGQASSYANWILTQRKDAVPRLRGISLEAGSDDSLWAALLTLDIDDRITVVRTFPSAFGLNRDFWIGGVREDIVEGLNRHLVEWQLSAAGTVPWLIVGHATAGLVGTGVLAY